MGLDNVISRSADDDVLTPEDERALNESGISLCGGVFSDGVTSFRGKVYDRFVSEVTGVSLHQEPLESLEPDTVHTPRGRHWRFKR